MPKKKGKKKTIDISLPYPHVLLEDIPPEKFEEWIKTVKPEAQEEVRRLWAEGRAFFKLDEKPPE